MTRLNRRHSGVLGTRVRCAMTQVRSADWMRTASGAARLAALTLFVLPMSLDLVPPSAGSVPSSDVSACACHRGSFQMCSPMTGKYVASSTDCAEKCGNYKNSVRPYDKHGSRLKNRRKAHEPACIAFQPLACIKTRRLTHTALLAAGSVPVLAILLLAQKMQLPPEPPRQIQHNLRERYRVHGDEEQAML